MRLRTKVLLWVLGLLCGFVLILIAVLCYILSNVFADKPLPPPPYHQTADDFTSAISKLNQHLAKILNEKPDPDQLSEISFTVNEVNALLCFTSQKLNIDLNRKYDTPRNYLFLYLNDDHILEVTASKYWDNFLPFGDYINARVELELKIAEAKTDVNVKEAMIGEWNLPVGFTQRNARRILNRDLSRKGKGGITNGVFIEEMKIEKGMVHIYYYPEKFRVTIESMMNNMQSPSEQELDFEDLLTGE